jgi:hypothetical protein
MAMIRVGVVMTVIIMAMAVIVMGDMAEAATARCRAASGGHERVHVRAWADEGLGSSNSISLRP